MPAPLFLRGKGAGKGVYMRFTFFGALVCAVLASCGLIGGGDDEVVTQDAKDLYYLEVSSNRSFYNLGDEFNKTLDFKVFKGRIDGSLRIRIPNEECIVSIDGNVVDPGIPFNFWGDTRVDVEHDGLNDWYIAVVNSSEGRVSNRYARRIPCNEAVFRYLLLQSPL